MNNVAELGGRKNPANYGAARRALRDLDPDAEARLKQTRTYGAGAEPPQPEANEHFGPIIISCDRAELRLSPGGVELFGDNDRSFIEAPLDPAPRKPVIDALVEAVRQDNAPTQTGRWGRASLEVCNAILTSAARRQAVTLRKQCGIETKETQL